MFSFKLFNGSVSSQTLNSFIYQTVKICALTFPDRQWKFYAMTCYFNQDTAQELAKNLQENILHPHIKNIAPYQNVY